MNIHNSDLSYPKIAAKYNVGEATVHLIKSGKKYSEITGGKKEKKRVVSDEQVLFIRNSGLSTKELMGRLGLSKSFINKIKSKRTYSWI